MATAPGTERTDAEAAAASESDFAKAFQDLARGEQTASALEIRLAEVESKIDQLLASVQESADQGEQHVPDQVPKENGAALNQTRSRLV